MNLTRFFILSLLSLLLTQCRAASTTSTALDSSTDPNISGITNTVATNAGSTALILESDILFYTNNIRDNLDSTVDDVTSLGGQSAGGGELSVIDFSLRTSPYVETIDISYGTETCDAGGTKTMTGTAVMTVNQDVTAGTLVGSFDVVYDGCLDNALVTYRNGTCLVEPSITGTISTTINIDFRYVSFQGLLEVRDETVTDTTTTSAFSINVGSTNSSQSYDFNYDVSSITNPTVTGSFSYNTALYSISDLETFLGNAAESVACPE